MKRLTTPQIRKLVKNVSESSAPQIQKDNVIDYIFSLEDLSPRIETQCTETIARLMSLKKLFYATQFEQQFIDMIHTLEALSDKASESATTPLDIDL